MARRILRQFKIREISGVDRPAQAHATVAIMKRDDEMDQDGFNAHGNGPVHDRLRALFDNFVRGRPHLSNEQNFAAAWNMLSLSERNQIRAEETGEAARLRSPATIGKAEAMNIDTGALAMLALEGAATAIRKREPHLTREQCFSKAYLDPENREAVKAERQASRERLSVIPVARTAPTILNELSDDEIHALVDEIRRDNPFVSDAELVRMIADSAEARQARASFREGVRLATRDGERVPQPSVALDSLTAKAMELRKADPSLTPEQAFSKAYQDPANRSLAARERQAARDALHA
jgi:hypothetical protein